MSDIKEVKWNITLTNGVGQDWFSEMLGLYRLEGAARAAIPWPSASTEVLQEIARLTRQLEAIRAAAAFALSALPNHSSADDVPGDTVMVLISDLRAFQGALEGAGRAGWHRGDPCEFCGTPHDDVAVGDCPGQQGAEGVGDG